MKSSWRKRLSKKRQSAMAIQNIPQKPAPWVPPYPVISNSPSVEEGFISKPSVIYNLPSISDQKIEPQTKVSRVNKSGQVRKEFMKIFQSLTYRWRSWDIWSDFVTMVACTISNAVDKLHFGEREKTYLGIINKYNREERELFPKMFAYLILALEENPEQDFLGDIYTELGLNSREHEQIFTPYHICHLMADITLGNLVEQIKEKRVIEIHDSCCGAGATLIAAANVAREKLKDTEFNYQNHVLITGQDIDGLVTMMCYIQLSLLGMAGYFKVGNALTDPMTNGDSLDNYWFTPMYFFPVWHYRRVWHSIDKLFGGTENE